MNNKAAKDIINKITNNELIPMIKAIFGKRCPDMYKFVPESFPDFAFVLSPIYQKFTNEECTTMESRLHVRVTNLDITEFIASFIIGYSANIEKMDDNYKLVDVHNITTVICSHEFDELAIFICLDAQEKGLRYLFDYDISSYAG